MVGNPDQKNDGLQEADMTPDSNPVAAVDATFLYIIGFSVVFLTFITILMLYFVFRYRAKNHPVPKDIRGNTKLEIAWMVIPTFIALSMFYFGWQSYLGLRNVPPGAIEIDVTGEMFTWNFTYPNGKKTQDILVVPLGKPIKLNITSADVNHSLSIPAYRVKMDAVKGLQTYVWFMADKVGEYKVLCTEYCGVSHSEMIADMKIVAPERYAQWLEEEPEAVQVEQADYMATDDTMPDFDSGEVHHLEDKMSFWWIVEGPQLHVKLEAATSGWVGIGFNPVDRMKGANFVLGAVVQGKVLVTDEYGTGYSKHGSDSTRGGRMDVKNVYGQEADGVTQIGFSIALDTGDEADTVILPQSDDTVVLLAHSAGLDSFSARHSFRGTYRVNLSTGEFKKIN
jgi:cytochrome c oxidase subunit 2